MKVGLYVTMIAETKDLQAFCENQHYTVSKVYLWSNDDNPLTEQVFNDLRAKTIDAVAISSLGRIGIAFGSLKKFFFGVFDANPNAIILIEDYPIPITEDICKNYLYKM